MISALSGWQGVVAALLLVVAIAAVVVAIRQTRRMWHHREMVRLLFRNIGSGVVVYDAQGIILLVNEQACRILGREEAEVLNSKVDAYFSGNWISHRLEGEQDLSQCYFKRLDGTLFPVTFELATVTLPADALTPRRRYSLIEVVIMTFSDISPVLEMQQKLKDAERMKEAALLAIEIAHEIRNPLAAISGSAQLLQALEERAAGGDRLSRELLDHERVEAFKRIVAESDRLDKVLAHFIDATEASPSSFSKLQDFIARHP